MARRIDLDQARRARESARAAAGAGDDHLEIVWCDEIYYAPGEMPADFVDAVMRYQFVRAFGLLLTWPDRIQIPTLEGKTEEEVRELLAGQAARFQRTRPTIGDLEDLATSVARLYGVPGFEDAGEPSIFAVDESDGPGNA